MTKKLSGARFVMALVAIATAVLSFVSLAFKFFKMVGKSPLGKVSDTFNLNESMDQLKDLKDYSEADALRAARVLMIIVLVLVALLAVAMLVKLFVSNKVLDIVVMVLSGLTVVLAIAFFITYVVGLNNVANFYEKLSGGMTTVKMYAHVAVYALTLFPVATAVLSFLSTFKKAK